MAVALAAAEEEEKEEKEGEEEGRARMRLFRSVAVPAVKFAGALAWVFALPSFGTVGAGDSPRLMETKRSCHRPGARHVAAPARSPRPLVRGQQRTATRLSGGCKERGLFSRDGRERGSGLPTRGTVQGTLEVQCLCVGPRLFTCAPSSNLRFT